MIVSQVIQNLSTTVREIVNALSNRLTARDNWGPEGEKFQVLTSNGPGPNDLPPSFQNITDILSGISTVTGAQGIPGIQGPQGIPGPPGIDGANGMVPTYIAPGETFTIPAFRQAMWAVPIVVDGTIVIDGVLVPVD